MKYPDLGLSVSEVVARYLRHIADGPPCVAELNRVGFDRWCEMWWRHHALQAATSSLEWDSRNYTRPEMRQIFDEIIAHASRRARA